MFIVSQKRENMNASIYKYLKQNNFRVEKDKLVSDVIADFKFVADGFGDKRQLALVKAQFGDELAKVESMSVAVKELGCCGYDVELDWTMNFGNDKICCSSKIGGEGDLYHLVSQAIVLAVVD